jgi:hypothetical protein
MRIISDQRDYYDCVQALGQDQSLIYVRKPYVEIITAFEDYFDDLGRTWFGDSLIKDRYVIGFCGKVYPLLRLDTSLCYSLVEVDHFVETHFNKKLVDRYYAKPKTYWRETWRRHRHSNYAKFFQTAKQHAEKYSHLFKEPIFVARVGHETKITYNACLRKLEFYRVIDPYTTFQELQVYLGGLASPEKPIPRIGDKTMASCKGFDKWSFRKDPQ